VRVRFPRPFSEKPALNVTARVGTVAKSIQPKLLTRRGFKVRVNAIPLVEQSYELAWEATGEVQPFVFEIFRWAAGIGAVLALYATLLELGWIDRLLNLATVFLG